MTKQFEIQLAPYPRGFHLITDVVRQHIGDLPESGLLHLFILHTSAGITINENADPTVLQDFERYFNRLAPEDLEGIVHTMEGPDDMPAHIKAALTGPEVTIPIRNGQLRLGTWQGIYLCEFRNRPRPRTLLATIYT